MGLVTSAIVGGIGMLGSTVMGAVQAGEERDLARGAMADAMREIKSVGAPPDIAREIIYEKFKQAGVLTPEVERQIDLGVSQLSQIVENEKTKAAEYKALDQLQQRAAGGLTAEDRAALNQAKAEVAQQTNAQQQSILQNMSQRGMGGSGAELAAKLAASQAGSNTLSQQGIDIGAQASRNALQAALQSGEFAGSLGQREFARDSERARATDAVNQFNVQNAVSRQQRNVDRSNQSNLYNLQRQQTVADANTQQANQELLRQRQAEMERWRAQLDQAAMASGAYQQQAQQNTQNAQAVGSQWGQVASGMGSLAGTFGTAAMKQDQTPAATPTKDVYRDKLIP